MFIFGAALLQTKFCCLIPTVLTRASSRFYCSLWSQLLGKGYCYVPCHCKWDTEAIAQVFLPRKKEVLEKKKVRISAPDFNEAVWRQVLKMTLVQKMLRRGWKFHHEISTNGVSISVLYSKSTICNVKETKFDRESNEGGGGGEKKDGGQCVSFQ